METAIIKIKERPAREKKEIHLQPRFNKDGSLSKNKPPYERNKKRYHENAEYREKKKAQMIAYMRMKKHEKEFNALCNISC